jgi:AmmeMemoRadiSam system protein B
VLLSSDLSHYHDYDAAARLDRATAEAILALRPELIDRHGACCHAGLVGLMRAAEDRGLAPAVACLRNSGDVAGRRDQVVGYGAFAFYSAST